MKIKLIENRNMHSASAFSDYSDTLNVSDYSAGEFTVKPSFQAAALITHLISSAADSVLITELDEELTDCFCFNDLNMTGQRERVS